ncbi:hypothetical protein IWQ62_003351, partial [Dispira parvispora]
MTALAPQSRLVLTTERGDSRYKYVVTVDLGENKGEGARVSAKCSWDCNVDSVIQETFTN